LQKRGTGATIACTEEGSEGAIWSKGRTQRQKEEEKKESGKQKGGLPEEREKTMK